MELRPYQQEAKDAIFEQWDSGVLKTLLVLPTGCGKTVVFAKVTEDCVRQGSRVLILAHRGELLDQAADKLKKTTGLGCAVEKAESSCQGTWFRVVVGSVQTLMREKRLSSFDSDYFDTIIIDEAHHCISDSYQRVLQHFSGAHVLGVTATPDRGDMKNLGTYFESLAYEYTLPKAIKEGYLSPIKALTIPLKIDMSSVSVQAGDFKASDISTALDPYLQGIAEEMKKYCQDKKTVVFLPLVKTSQKFRDLLNENGFRAAEVNGDSQDRAEILKDFDSGKYNVLCNSMLLTEGWDCPSVDCIVVLRPTKVRSLYCQMVGRGTRLSPETGKDHLLLLDFLWHTERHELCHPANSADQMANFCNQFDKVCTELGCAVIYCHHHSKGSQGGKKSMDRASGSGVFARDPDALLDLTELEPTEALMKQEENKAICAACKAYLDAHFEWQDDLSQDDLLSSTQMMDYCKEHLDKWQMIALERQVEAAKAVAKSKTAWRIEGTLREFPKFEPVNLWFDYPVHRIDQVGSLRDLQLETEKPMWEKAAQKRKENAQKNRERKLNEFEIAFQNIEFDGKEISATELAEALDTTSKELLSWLGEGRRQKKELRAKFEKYTGDDGKTYIKRKGAQD